MNRAKRKRALASNDPPVETTEELRARLRTSAQLTREQAVRRVRSTLPKV